MKRFLDFIVSLLVLTIFLIPMLIISLLLLVKMGTPITFKQKRPGLKGKPFYIKKFRTMTNNTDPSGNLLPREKRLTKTGKTLRKLSLDELPQLFNVLKGDLSLVGPRPLLMDYLTLYNPEQARRHDVRPGITGWAQVNGRNTITWEEKFYYDVWYVDNQSFSLDIKILFLTFLKVFKKEGISPGDKQFVERFKGSSKINEK